MSRTQGSRWLLIAASLLFFAALPGPMLRADLYVYDLDSLVHLSTEVVEAEVLRSYEAHGQNLIDVKLTLVHKGGLEKGQTVAIAHTAFYRKPKNGFFNSQQLAAGDRLVLFLLRAEPNGFFRIPEDAVIYTPVDGGMRLIQGDHVFGFAQWNNPGPYVANVPPDPEKAKSLTLVRFRDKLRDSLRDTPKWARLVEAKQDELDVPRLLKLLADRTRVTLDGRDFFTERTCMRFAEGHDPVLLGRALAVAKSYHEVSILQRGFGTPKGRDYLLAKVTDATEPMPARLRYSRALSNAGEVYRSALIEIGDHSWREVGKADESNSHYLTRIATAARANAQHEELCGSLVSCLDYFGRGFVQNKPAPLMADLKGAFAVLKELYETKPSEELQFAVEKAMASYRDAYEKLQSPCGNFISLLRPVDPPKYTRLEKRSLIFEYEYTTLLLSPDTEVRPAVVLVDVKTRKTYVLPTQLRILDGRSSGGGSNSVVLPEDLPAGTYKVFFQLRDADKVISTGHCFTANL